ncbi:MAG: hypothetical protein U9P90_01390, partial [Patescibacteria group bacterium]|nr:hypothetical protein [Patescibacteria group bacterium]
MEIKKIHKIFGILASKKARVFVLACLFVLIGVFSVVQLSFAGWEEIVLGIIGHLAEFIVFLTGQLIALVTFVLIAVANYNSFTDSPAVGMGWVIVRDIANMFFVVIFLVIAFGT